MNPRVFRGIQQYIVMHGQPSSRYADFRDIETRIGELKPQFLRGLKPEEIALVLRAATVVDISSRTVLIEEHRPADTIYLLLEGRARAFTTTPTGEKVIMFWVPQGAAVGAVSLMSRRSIVHPLYMLSADVVSNTSALVWKDATIVQLKRRYPMLLDNCLVIALAYINEFRHFAHKAHHPTAEQRVSTTLERMAREIGTTNSDGSITIYVKNEDIAIESGVTIFTVSRVLSTLEKQGIVEKRRGSVCIQNIGAVRNSLMV